jgi:hypothetical protein
MYLGLIFLEMNLGKIEHEGVKWIQLGSGTVQLGSGTVPILGIANTFMIIRLS